MTSTRFARATVRVLVGAIRFYRLAITPWLAPRCRFAPSCSAYAIEAVEVHGPWQGIRLAVSRLGRCHPWNAGGHDPVPAVDRSIAGEHGPADSGPPGIACCSEAGLHSHPARR